MQNKKKVLIIAPHPDDEINLAGQLCITLKRNKYEFFVVYITNGDYKKSIGNKRLYEALEANSVLGIPSSNIIILGYANEYEGPIHIYNALEDSCLKSKIGKKRTNSIKEKPEYCFKKKGIHRKFNKKSIRYDFESVMLELLPDLIICPEFDSHPDHRATSLLFDEVMCDILKKKSWYRPIVLKKYIHEGVWSGPKDYYEFPMRPTLTSGPRFYSGMLHELDTPNLKWDERICWKPDQKTLTPLLIKNIVFNAARKHRSTTAWYEMQRVINADMVYWHKPTDNIALNAEVLVSSGNGKYVNDYKYYDSDDLYNINNPFTKPECFCWQPDALDKKKSVELRFTEDQVIKCIRIYEDCNWENHIKSIVLDSDEKTLYKGPLNNDGSKTEIILNEKIYTKSIILYICDYDGNPGIAEIEVFSENVKSPQLLLRKGARENKAKNTVGLFRKIEKMMLILIFLFKFKIRYEFEKIWFNRFDD